MPYPQKQEQCGPSPLSTAEWLVRDALDALRERGVESRATPMEVREIAYGHRDLRSVLL